MTTNRLHPFLASFRVLDELEREFRASRRELPPVNVETGNDEATAVFELPGVTLDAIDVHVDGNELTVAAARDEQTIGDGEWGLHERRAGSLRRTIRLPFEIDREGVAARYVDGLLTILLPRAEADKPARIAVSGAAS